MPCIGTDDEDDSNVITFELVAFVKHIGSQAKSGHYVAVIKTGGTWELHDDNMVSNLHESAVFCDHSFANIYLLTYNRID